MTRRLQWGGVWLVTAAVLLASCSRAPEDEVVATVRAYAKAIAIANEELELKPVESLVTEKQLEEIRYLHHYLMLKESSMVSRLEELTVENVEVKEERATVETSERWTFIMLDERTGRQKEEPQAIRYHNRYYLLKEDRTWRVAEVQADVT